MNIQTKTITLDLKEPIEAMRFRHGHATASHAFASLYIWQKDMGLSVYMEEDLFAVKCSSRGENAWFFPCGGQQAVHRFLDRALTGDSIRLCYMREEDGIFLEKQFPGRFQILPTPEDSEYIYGRAQQEELKGRKFSALRNHINRVQSDHILDWFPLGDWNLEEALDVNREWEPQPGKEGGLQDSTASKLLLRGCMVLDVRGVVVRVDGEPFAVAAGFPLSRDTFDMSLVKQKSSLSGLSVYTKHAFICSLPPAYTLINAEEDLGISGLRTMKHQMRPVGQIRLYEGRAVRNGETGQ